MALRPLRAAPPQFGGLSFAAQKKWRMFFPVRASASVLAAVSVRPTASSS